MDREIVLEARGVSMQYPGTLALDGVTFQLRAGTVSALIGENGAGKSTLVKILAGIDQPTSGTLLLDGSEITIHSVRDAELEKCPNLNGCVLLNFCPPERLCLADCREVGSKVTGLHNHGNWVQADKLV